MRAEPDDAIAISPASGLANGIILLRAVPGRARTLALLNHLETEARIRYFDGFVGACFLVEIGGPAVLALVQWRRIEDLLAITGEPFYAEHVPVCAAMIESKDGGFYRCKQALCRDGPEVSAGAFTIAGRERTSVAALIFAAGVGEAESFAAMLCAKAEWELRRSESLLAAAVFDTSAPTGLHHVESGVTKVVLLARFDELALRAAIEATLDSLAVAASGVSMRARNLFMPHGSSVPDRHALTPLRYRLLPLDSPPPD